MATLILTVVILAAVMMLLVFTPVLFRRYPSTGGPFDVYFEQQCILYMKSLWDFLRRQDDAFLAKRQQVVYLSALAFCCSLMLPLAAERDPKMEFKGWFKQWLAHEGGQQVQLKLLLVAWHFATVKQPALRDKVLVDILQRWQ